MAVFKKINNSDMNDDIAFWETRVASNLREALSTNIYANQHTYESEDSDECEVDSGDEVWGNFKNNGLADLIKEAVREAINEENTPVIPKIEKYYMKHK